MDIKTTDKANFKFGQISKPGARTVSLYITSVCGLLNTEKNVVLSSLYTDLVSAGCDKLSRDEFQFKLDELGSAITVTSENGSLTFQLSSLESNLKKTLALLELMLKSPAFKPAELKRASETLANSIEQMKEDAKSLALSGLKNSFFNPSSQNYDFDLDTLGTHIASCSITDLKKLHTLVLNAEWTVTVGGSANSVKTAEACINKLKPSKDLPAEESETTFIGTKGRQVVIIEVKSKQNIEFSIGGYLPLTLKDKELPAFMFGLSVLGKWGGFSGRLMSTVREKEGLTYGIYAQVQGLNVSRAGYWRIMTFFSPKDTVKGVTSTLREINLIQNKGITDGEVTRFQTILKTSDALLIDSLLSTTRLVHRVLVSGQTWADYQDFRQKLYTCTKTEVNKALKEYLDISELTISAAGPTTSVKKELESFKK